MTEQFDEHLFEYRYDGRRWAFSIYASSSEDAEARLKALAWGKYQGRLVERLPASSLRAPLVPAFVWWRNWRVRRTAKCLAQIQ